jgi:hypothetical protein
VFSQAVCIKRRTRDADTVSDNIHALAGGDGRACGLKIFSGEGTWPSAETSLGTSRDEPGQGALANEITLELSLMMYRHGLRVSEAIGLRRDHVNLENAVPRSFES